MYDKRAKQDALDLWFSMPGEMSVDDFAAELGYPSGSTLRNWIKADPRHDPDKCQYRSKPVLPKLEAIRRVAEGATAAQAARETGLTPQQVRYSVGRYARGGTAALLPAWHFGALEGFALVLAADVLMIQRHHRGIARALRGEERRALRGKTAREK